MADDPGIGPDRVSSTDIDTRVPHSARIWNYWLGGKDNSQVDRTAGDGVVRAVLDQLPSGSHLAICDNAHHPADVASQQAKRDYADTGASPYHNRSHEEPRGLFAGLDLVDPGFVSAPLWKPAQPADQPVVGTRPQAPIDLYAG